MIKKGGYILVDCTGFNFADLSKKLPQLYKDLDVAYAANKFVLCENMVNSATAAKFTPIPAFVAKVGTTIVLTVMNLAYNIAPDGTITN